MFPALCRDLNSRHGGRRRWENSYDRPYAREGPKSGSFFLKPLGGTENRSTNKRALFKMQNNITLNFFVIFFYFSHNIYGSFSLELRFAVRCRYFVCFSTQGLYSLFFHNFLSRFTISNTVTYIYQLFLYVFTTKMYQKCPLARCPQANS